MDNIRKQVKPFLDKYAIIFIILFALLTLLPYVSYLKILQISNNEGLIYRGILFVLITIFFLLIIVIYKSTIPIYITVTTAIYLVSQIITIIVSPIIKDAYIPTLMRTMGIGQAIITSISIIAYSTIHKDCEFHKKTINITCLFMMSFGLLLCLYTYVFEYDDIYNTFNTIYGWNYDVTSIFTMKTEYGFVLFICSIFSIYYILNNKRYWLYCVPLFFLINMFISRSKTSILTTTIILLSLFIIHIVQSWDRYKKYWITVFICIGIFVSALVALIISKIGWFEKLNYYVTQVIFGDAQVVLNDRIHKWSLLLQAVDNPFYILFGYGERITPIILSNCGCATIGDNIYLSSYGVGGIIKLFTYIVLLIFIIVNSWNTKCCTYKKIIVLVIQISFIIGGLFEDDSIVGVTMPALFSSIVFYSCNKMIRTDLQND